MTPAARYGTVSQLLHWMTALLVVILLASGKIGLVGADHPASAEFMWHGSLGLLVLVLAAARLLWRWMSPAPEYPRTMTRFGRIAARTMHVSLYALLIALPLSGWLSASAEGSNINFFNVATLPRWQRSSPIESAPAAVPRVRNAPEAAGEGREDLEKELHELLGDALLILVSLHFLAALKHQFIDHDGLIRRMLPAPRPRSAEPHSGGG